LEYVTGYGTKNKNGRALGTKIRMPDLKSFMLMDYASFQEQPQLDYGCGLLLTTYFLHMDGDLLSALRGPEDLCLDGRVQHTVVCRSGAAVFAHLRNSCFDHSRTTSSHSVFQLTVTLGKLGLESGSEGVT
ncbi:MAG: hypothetical protein RL454_1161, partial [Actinomycetota bacterium]